MEKLKKIDWWWIPVGFLWIGVMVVLLPIRRELLLACVVGVLITAASFWYVAGKGGHPSEEKSSNTNVE